jgi:hypothetical protein
MEGSPRANDRIETLRRGLSRGAEAARRCVSSFERPVAEAKRAYELAVERAAPVLAVARSRLAEADVKYWLFGYLVDDDADAPFLLYRDEERLLAEVIALLAGVGLRFEVALSRHVLEKRVRSRYAVSKDCDYDDVGWVTEDGREPPRFRPDAGEPAPAPPEECERYDEFEGFGLRELEIRDVDYDGDHHGVWAYAWAGTAVGLARARRQG